MKMTYDEFDAKCEYMEAVNEKFPTKPYFPSEEDIRIMAEEVDKYYDLIVYLVSTNPLPSTPEEAYSMKLLNKLISEYTEFTE